MKVVKLGKHFGVQSKYSDSLPAFVDCQKDSESTGENGTQVKLVLLEVEIFAVRVLEGPLRSAANIRIHEYQYRKYR